MEIGGRKGSRPSVFWGDPQLESCEGTGSAGLAACGSTNRVIIELGRNAGGELGVFEGAGGGAGNVLIEYRGGTGSAGNGGDGGELCRASAELPACGNADWVIMGFGRSAGGKPEVFEGSAAPLDSREGTGSAGNGGESPACGSADGGAGGTSLGFCEGTGSANKGGELCRASAVLAACGSTDWVIIGAGRNMGGKPEVLEDADGGAGGASLEFRKETGSANNGDELRRISAECPACGNAD